MLYLSAQFTYVMDNDGTSFNKSGYNIFTICQEFKQRLEELQRLKSLIKPEKQDLENTDVSKENK
jgi:hypothetical protein